MKRRLPDEWPDVRDGAREGWNSAGDLQKSLTSSCAKDQSAREIQAMPRRLSVLVIGDGNNLRPSRQLLVEAKNQGMRIHIDSIDSGFDLTNLNKPGNMSVCPSEETNECLLQEVVEPEKPNEYPLQKIAEHDGESTVRLIIGCLSDPAIQMRLAKEYDLCFMLETVQFLPIDGSVQREIIKRLRIGGRAIISAAETIDAQRHVLSALTLLATSDPELKRGFWPGPARAINRAPGVGKCAIEHLLIDDMVLVEKFTFRSVEVLSEKNIGAEIMRRGFAWLHSQQNRCLKITETASKSYWTQQVTRTYDTTSVFGSW